MNEETAFLTVVQESEFKKDASLKQLLCLEGEEVEELLDDYGYEAILAREHDDELEELLGTELFNELERRVFTSSSPREELISFVNGLGFHILDWIVVLEMEYGIANEVFSSDIIKKMEKRLPHFPYLEKDQTIFNLNVQEVSQLLEKVTDGQIRIK
jgi:hypothetical protein